MTDYTVEVTGITARTYAEEVQEMVQGYFDFHNLGPVDIYINRN